MKDWLHSTLSWLDHNRYLALAIVLSAVAVGLATFAGCASRTPSVITGEPVTRPVFEREVADRLADLEKAAAVLEADIKARQAALAADVRKAGTGAELGTADLDRQDEMKREIAALLLAQAEQAAAGTWTPTGLVQGAGMIVGLLLGLGSGADNLRKNSQVKDRDERIAALEAQLSKAG